MSASKPIQNDALDTICAVALIDSNHKVLLQLRDEKPGLNSSGLWVFPGGHQEIGEDLEECATREFLEETDYLCTQLRWLMQIHDSFVNAVAQNLHVFWDRYDGHSAYTCKEGQALEFIARQEAKNIAIPEYLISIWDLVILASKKS